MIGWNIIWFTFRIDFFNDNLLMKTNISILGSTGSIGLTTLKL